MKSYTLGFALLVLSIVGGHLALAKTIRYEAEAAHVVGAGRVSTDIKGFSGSGFVDFEPTDWAAIIFSVNIPYDGDYFLSFAYTALSEASELSIRTNGIEQTISKLSAAELWSVQVESIPFRQGLNSIVLKTFGSVSAKAVLSVDFVEIEGAIPLAVRGATLPYFEIEAESASYNGQLIGPNRALYQLPTEASGRFAVTLNQGQYVEFTLTGSANALVVRFSIPDTSNGSGQVAPLNVLVDGAQALTLNVSSIFSWAYGDYPFTKNPGDGKPHHFYDEVRGMFGKTLLPGTKVRLVAVNSIPYTIDLADFYTAPAPYTMPANFISIVDHGADPTGQKDSTLAFNQTIAAAYSGGKSIWIPQGVFLVTQRFALNKVTVRGAGPWYSTVKATVVHGVGFFGNWAPNPSTDVELYDFAILGDTNVRVDTAVDSGVGGAFLGNSIAQNLWIEHTKCGMWLDGPFNGLHVTGCTIRNTYADGINLHMGISNVVVEQTIIRNVGDDALAVWAENVADINNTFQFNTIQVPVLANGIALYGGTDNSATDNYVADSICDGGGLQIGNRYNAVGVAGNTLFARNTLERCGAPSRFGPQDCGSIWAWQSQGAFAGTVTFLDNESYNSSYAAFTFWDGTYNANVVISGLTVVGGPYVMEVNSGSGTVPCDHVIATGLTTPYGGVHSCAGLVFVDKGGNTGWNLSHDSQHCN